MRQDEIAAATARVIARKGLAATTLRDIAREAGFTTGVITHHFPDKTAVVADCFYRTSERWLAKVEAAVTDASTPRMRLAALLDLSVPSNPDDQASWCIWAEMWTYAGRDPSLAKTVVAVDGRWEMIVADVLAEARAAKIISEDVEPVLEAANFVRLVDGLGLRAWVSGEWSHARAQMLRYLEVLGLRGTLEHSPLPAG